MAFIPVTNVLQTELIYSFENQIMENVLHYVKGGGWTEANMAAFGAVLASWFSNDGKSMFSQALSLVNIRMTDLTTQNSGGLEYAIGLPIAGTWTGDHLPANCALCITKRTANRGRSYRGRMYLPGIPEGQTTGSFVAQSYLDIVHAKLAMIDEFSIDSVPVLLGVVTRYTNGAPRAQGIFTPVTQLVGNRRIDSQRRRLPGVGQ